jgi:hydroxymethylpyrimidine kinase/phosphomethylpyrimidine kinase
MVATTGARLLPHEAVQILISDLLPLTTVLTPNLPEAQLLAKEAGKPSTQLRDVDDLKKLAEFIATLGPKYVLLKGGHLPMSKDRIVTEDEAEKLVVLNVLYGEGRSWVFESEYLKSNNTHGTGCSLACECLKKAHRKVN